MKDKEQQYEDGYYFVRFVGDIEYEPIKIINQEVYRIGYACGCSTEIYDIKDIKPLELPKPKREVGNYWAKVYKDDDKEIIHYDGDNYFFRHGEDTLYTKEYFDWIDDKKIELLE